MARANGVTVNVALDTRDLEEQLDALGVVLEAIGDHVGSIGVELREGARMLRAIRERPT